MCNVTSSDASLADDRAIKSYLFCSIARLNIWRIGISMLPVPIYAKTIRDFLDPTMCGLGQILVGTRCSLFHSS